MKIYNKIHKKLLLAEVVLIVASVFIFRGLWHLLDMVPIMNDERALWLSLVVGIMVSIPAIRYIIRNGHHL